MKTVVRELGRFFIDPLSVKELSGIARRWQVYLGRCVYILLVGFILWLFWSNLTRQGNWMSPSAYAELGRTLFYSFFGLQMAVVTLGGVSAGSDMITREIRAGTLGLLALTPLTPWRIVAGKWKAALIQTSTVLLCGAPVFAVCVFLGGVGLRELAYSLTLSVVSASLGAAVALLCSSLFRAGYVATIVSLISLVVYCALPPIVLFAMLDLEEGGMTLLTWTHPLFAAVGAAMPPMMGIRREWGQGWISASLITSGLVLLLLRWSAARVRLLIRRPAGDAPAAPTLDDLGPAPVARSPRIAFLARILRGQRGVWQTNAILWKELSTRRVGGKAATAGVALLGFLCLTTLGAESWWRLMILWFSWIVLYLISLANGVSLFVTEREERKWDILLSTPLRSRDLVWAKLCAGLAGVAPMAFVLSVFWFLTALAYRGTPSGAAITLTAVLLGALLTYLVGAFASLVAHNQRTAFSTAFGVLLGFLAVFPAVIGMLEGFDVLPRHRYAETIIAGTNPGAYLVYLSKMLERRYSYGNSYQSDWISLLRTAFPAYVLIFAVLIIGLVVAIHRRFDRATGRS
jgi:ABC-type transport system involved in multi-copper enzyme maturation permease subunit